MGTIRINPQAVAQSGSFTVGGGGTTAESVLSAEGGNIKETSVDQAICLGVPFVHAPDAGSYELDCSVVSTILVDGVATDFAGLPAGFTITGLTLNLVIQTHNGVADGGNNCYSVFKVLHGLDTLYNDPTIANGNHFPLALTVDITGMSPIDLFSDHWKFQMTSAANNAAATGCGSLPYASAVDSITGFYLTGTYALENFQFNLNNSSQPVESNVTQVTITSDPDDPDHLKLDQLDPTTPIQVDGTDVPLINIISQSEFELVFVIFFTGTPQVVTVSVTGNGTQFSGSVTLGKLETIYFLNAPGIYFLDSSATADVLYDTDNGGTIEVAIPDPFGKTGFIGN